MCPPPPHISIDLLMELLYKNVHECKNAKMWLKLSKTKQKKPIKLEIRL